MRVENRRYLAEYLTEAEPINDGFVEERWVFEMRGHIYQISDNWPHWTQEALLDFVRHTLGREPYKLQMRVTPIIPSQREEDSHE